MSSSVGLGVVWTAAMMAVFAIKVAIHEWRTVSQRVLREFDEMIGHQDLVFPTFRKFGELIRAGDEPVALRERRPFDPGNRLIKSVTIRGR